ncbi:sensor histidine kinase [Clostridium sp. LP20]|uniref:sensor histidine kinase n=1 Tax=Clostridium sp. LP20 TaxID=3418665 RepID=UPI003EE6C963
MIKEIIGGIFSVIQIFICLKVLGIAKLESKNIIWKFSLIAATTISFGLIFRPLVIISLVIECIIFLISEKNEIFKSIIATLISIIIAIILEMSVYPIIIIITGGKLSDLATIVCVGGLSSILTYIICKMIREKVLVNYINRFKGIIEVKGTYANVSNAFLILLIFTVNTYFISNSTEDKGLYIFSIVVSVIYSIVIIYLGVYSFKGMKNQVEESARKRQIEDLTEYNRNLEEMYNDMRKFRHDYINILSSMVGYMEDEDMDGLKKYFNKNILPLGTEMGKNNLSIGLLHNIKIKEIKGIILTKILKAQELGVEVIIDIGEEIEEANIDMIDLCKALGILMDNAIEAAARCEEGKIKIGFVKNKGTIYIIVINSIADIVAPIYKIYEKGFSTKGKSRGLGLSNLKEIVTKYPNVSLDTVIEEKEFHQILELS